MGGPQQKQGFRPPGGPETGHFGWLLLPSLVPRAKPATFGPLLGGAPLTFPYWRGS